MSLQLIFRPEAEAEVADAYAWYGEQNPGLGSHFLLCMEAALSQITRHPDASPVVHRKIRRTLLRRFPYGVFYILEDTRIVILAVFHVKRSPTLWKKRSPS
ncbi:type II toxin-antitoxin system RelE/ParE family toxin [Bdellovibrionota bacterium FG-2]